MTYLLQSVVETLVDQHQDRAFCVSLVRSFAGYPHRPQLEHGITDTVLTRQQGSHCYRSIVVRRTRRSDQCDAPNHSGYWV
jgi:hypothetical protein